jgi:hypothetical protein
LRFLLLRINDQPISPAVFVSTLILHAITFTKRNESDPAARLEEPVVAEDDSICELRRLAQNGKRLNRLDFLVV